QETAREIEIGSGVLDLGLAGSGVLQTVGCGHLDMGADGGAQRREERQCGDTIHLIAAIEVSIEDEIGEISPAAVLEIHQQEGEIVEHVDASQRPAELDAVEENRPSVDATDVAEMEIAVTLPDLAGKPPPLERLAHCGQ